MSEPNDPPRATPQASVSCLRAEFRTSVSKWTGKGVEPLPQVCFCGRSNVGKSSLLNALAGQRQLARASSTPGRTQSINVFGVTLRSGPSERRVNFVDLPGYGFAQAPESVRKAWRPMMQSYFRDNDLLRVAVVLLDIRRDPSDGDFELLQMLEEREIPALPVVTKIDKVTRGARGGELKRIAGVLELEDWRDLRPCSAETRDGIRELLADIWQATT